MFCSKCGKQLNDEATFCDGCGSAVKKSAEPETAGIQRAKAATNEKALIERSRKNRAITVIAILNSVMFLFLCLAGATKLSAFEWLFTDEEIIDYIWEESAGMLTFLGFMEGLCCLAEIVLCFVLYKRREFSAYKKIKLPSCIFTSIVVLLFCLILRKHITASGWFMAILFVVGDIISLISVLKAAKSEDEAIYLESSTYSRGRLHDKLSALRENDKKGDMWECEECGTLNPSTQGFCKDCGKYR